MKTKIFSLLIAFFLTATVVSAQTMERPFKGHFYNLEENIHLYLDLYESSLEAPGYSFLGPLNGYMKGSIYGIWLVTSHQVKDSMATLRLSNDQGSDAQEVELTMSGDTAIFYKAVDGNTIKKVVNRKLVKIPSELTFIRR